MSIDNLSELNFEKRPNGFFDKKIPESAADLPDEHARLRETATTSKKTLGQNVLIRVADALNGEPSTFRIPPIIDATTHTPRAGEESQSEAHKPDKDSPADERAKDPEGFYDF